MLVQRWNAVDGRLADQPMGGAAAGEGGCR
jgi:hypothetical protein